MQNAPGSSPQQIQLNTYVEESKVPLNGRVVFHIEISWQGELRQYKVEPVSPPVLRNLLLEGSGSENRLEPLEDGGFLAVKSIVYRLKPLELGMAYIDGITIDYLNRLTNEADQLTSQRVMVEITEPVKREGSGGIKAFVYIFLLVIFFGAVLYFLFAFFRKRKLARHTPQQEIPLAQVYLMRLSREVDPRGTNLTEMTVRLSRIFREYLHERYDIPAKELSTTEIAALLQQREIPEDERAKILDVLKKLDVIRFTGKRIEPDEFTNIYGTIETLLIQQQNETESVQVTEREE
ncbi:MAG: hypothetical protein WAN36_09850 [Calditrichia bacterium]